MCVALFCVYSVCHVSVTNLPPYPNPNPNPNPHPFLHSIQSWLDADADNIAVIHCLTGRGRTAALTACVLAWLGEFSSPLEALDYISARKKIPVDQLTIPSQRRYVQYFANTLDGVRPSSQPLLLRRIILNTVSKRVCVSRAVLKTVYQSFVKFWCV